MASSSLLFTHLAWIWISWYLNLHSDKESSLCLPKVSGTKPDHVCSKTLTWNTIWQAMLGHLDSPASDYLVFQAGAQFTSWSLPRHNSFIKMNLIGALLLGTSFLPILNLSLFWYKTELYAFNKFYGVQAGWVSWLLGTWVYKSEENRSSHFFQACIQWGVSNAMRRSK